jgi:hypothetical protein
VIQGNSPPPPPGFTIAAVVLTNHTDVWVEWTTMGGQSYVVQTNADLGNDVFHDLSGVIQVGGTGPGVTNYLHVGGATNRACFYRVRQGGGSNTNTVQTTNLLLNPGAETGDLTDWAAGGTFPPSVDDGTIGGSFNIYPHTGSNDFVGGGMSGSLSQVVSLVGNQGITAGELDSGQLLATISFWEQGVNLGLPTQDDADVALAFLDGSSNVLSSVTTPELDAHAGAWSNYTAHYVIPAGTRFIQYTVEFVPHASTFYGVYVDDNVLTVSSGPAYRSQEAVLPRNTISPSALSQK